MTQTFLMEDFARRVMGKDWAETDLAKILATLPVCSITGPWVAGGALRRTIAGTTLESDLDFFFANEGVLAAFAAKLPTLGLTKKKETEHHEQWEGYNAAADRSIVLQLIRFQYYANAAAVIESFDFTICQFAFDGMTLTCADYALWDLGRKRLAINKVTFPGSSMRRLLKYARQGFTACDGCLASLATAIADDPTLADNMHIKYVD